MKTTFFKRMFNHGKSFLVQQQDTPIKDGLAWLGGFITFAATTWLGVPIDPATSSIIAGFIIRTVAGIGKKD